MKMYKIPGVTVIPAGGYVVFDENDFWNGGVPNTNALIPFQLNEYGDAVYLYSVSGTGNLTGLMEGESFGATDNGVAKGRYQTSVGVDFTHLSSVTMGAQNANPAVGPVVINEIMYNPNQGSTTEFVELYNVSGGSVDISNWDLEGTGYIFPVSTVMSANGYLVLIDTNSTTIAQFATDNAIPQSIVHGSNFTLENEGESIRLEKPNPDFGQPDILVDRVKYNDKSPWPEAADGDGPSLERYVATDYGNDPINWRTTVDDGSPGGVNIFSVGKAFGKNSSWKFNVSGSDLGTVWQGATFIDSGWSAGDGILGYGETYINTVTVFNPPGPFTTYLRKKFVLNDNPANVSSMTLMANYDDGFVAYLNEQEVARRSIPAGPVNYLTTANGHEGGSYISINLDAHLDKLVPGVNILAVEVHQVGANSNDMVWDAELKYTVSSIPTVVKPIITPNGGTFTDPISVSISTSTSGATLYYTTDGSLPSTSSLLYTGPFSIATSITVNTYGVLDGNNDSSVASATYTQVPRTVSFFSASSLGGENNISVNLNVTLSTSAASNVTVAYAVTGGTAAGGGVDYTLANGTLTFTTGQTSKNINLSIIDDAEEEGNETVIVNLSNVTGSASLGSIVSHTYTITDTDISYKAYNDLGWFGGQISANITSMTRGGSGELVDYATGQGTGVTLTMNSGGGGPQSGQGANATGGDASSIFNSRVNSIGVVSYSTTALTLTFENLNPAKQYTVALYGNRDNASYTDRKTQYQITSAPSFTNQSSAGTTYTGGTDPTVSVVNGSNTSSGRVAAKAPATSIHPLTPSGLRSTL